ncbi:hypothetical protein F5884DRAFT_247469 [Xylogone sp. PMI_703]|nr:hypothetical protein F5884DRAFT_247469 [Xylogone sp. PMI_703]
MIDSSQHGKSAWRFGSGAVARGRAASTLLIPGDSLTAWSGLYGFGLRTTSGRACWQKLLLRGGRQPNAATSKSVKALCARKDFGIFVVFFFFFYCVISLCSAFPSGTTLGIIYWKLASPRSPRIAAHGAHQGDVSGQQCQRSPISDNTID